MEVAVHGEEHRDVDCAERDPESARDRQQHEEGEQPQVVGRREHLVDEQEDRDGGAGRPGGGQRSAQREQGEPADAEPEQHERDRVGERRARRSVHRRADDAQQVELGAPPRRLARTLERERPAPAREVRRGERQVEHEQRRTGRADEAHRAAAVALLPAQRGEGRHRHHREQLHRGAEAEREARGQVAATLEEEDAGEQQRDGVHVPVLERVEHHRYADRPAPRAGAEVTFEHDRDHDAQDRRPDTGHHEHAERRRRDQRREVHEQAGADGVLEHPVDVGHDARPHAAVQVDTRQVADRGVATVAVHRPLDDEARDEQRRRGRRHGGGARSQARVQDRPAKRSRSPHRVTRRKASTTMRIDIFEVPATRSRNSIGTSAMRPPARATR